MSDQKNKRIVNRSAAYPVITLEEAVSSMETIKSKLGKDNYNRKSLTEALGFETDGGIGARKVAALAHYGLIKRDGNVYRYEEVSDKILLPKTDEEKAQTLIELVKNPTLFNGLINKYQGQALPEMLKSVLSRDFSINEKMTEKVSSIFRDSIKYAGIYKNGIVSSIESNNIITEDEVDNDDVGATVENNDSANVDSFVNSTPSKGRVSLELPCGVTISYPESLSYNFAMGDFSEMIKNLNEEIQKKIDAKNS